MIWILSTVFIMFLILTLSWLITLKSQYVRQGRLQEKPSLAYEDLEIIRDGKKIKGWFIRAEGDYYEQPLIILIHGWGASKANMLRYVIPFHKESYNLILFDILGHGESSYLKVTSIKTLRDDIKAVLDYVKKREDVNSSRVALFGHSFGGFGAAVINSEDHDIKAVVTDSMPLSVKTIIKAGMKAYKIPYFPFGMLALKLMFFRAGLSREEVKSFYPVTVIKNRKAPLFMVHSKNDDYIPSREFETLVFEEQIPHLLTSNIGHRSSQQDPDFWNNVCSFYNKYV